MKRSLITAAIFSWFYILLFEVAICVVLPRMLVFFAMGWKDGCDWLGCR